MATLQLGSGKGIYTAQGVYVPNGALDIWRAARDNAANELVEVAILGDSTTVGSTGFSWVGVLRSDCLAAGFNDGGPGMLYKDDTAAQVGLSYLPCTSYTGGNGRPYGASDASSFTLQSSGQAATWAFKTENYRILYAATGDSGQFSYNDGTHSATITAGTDSTIKSQYVSGFTKGTGGSVTLNWVSGNNTMDMQFVNNTGISFSRIARGGSTSDDWGNNTTYGTRASGRFGVAPNVGSLPFLEGTHPQYPRNRLVIIHLGINDLNILSGLTLQDDIAGQISTTINNLGRLIHVAREGGASVLLVIPHFWVWTAFRTLGAALADSMWALGHSMGCAVADFNQALGGPVGKWDTSWYNPGDVHLTPAGYTQQAHWLWNNVLSK